MESVIYEFCLHLFSFKQIAFLESGVCMLLIQRDVTCTIDVTSFINGDLPVSQV